MTANHHLAIVSHSCSSCTHASDDDVLETFPVAYVEIDTAGAIRRANRVAREMQLPEHADQVIGKHIWDFVPPTEAEKIRGEFLAMIAGGEEPPIVRRTLFSNGGYRSYEIHRTLIRDVEGRIAGIRSATFDVTEAQRAQEEMERAKLWLESVLDSMSEAIVITDALGIVRSVNPATEAMFGWKADELKGKIVEQAFPFVSYVAESNSRLNFDMAIEQRSRGVATILDREKNKILVELSTSPITDKESGIILGVVSVMQRLNDVCDAEPATR